MYVHFKVPLSQNMMSLAQNLCVLHSQLNNSYENKPRLSKHIFSTCAALQGYRQEAVSSFIAMSVFLCTCAAQPLIAACAETVSRFLLFTHGAALRTKSTITYMDNKLDCTNQQTVIQVSKLSILLCWIRAIQAILGAQLLL